MTEVEPGLSLAGETAARAPLSDEEGAELRRQLVRSVGRLCPPGLTAEAEDIVQRAWLKIVHRLGEGTGPFGASYVWRVAYCVTVDEIRRRRRRAEVSLEDAVDGGSAGSVRTDPERLRAAAEIREAIADCLRRMLEPRMLAVTLHLQGHSLSEAGGILGWSAKRVENLVYRGLDDLRGCLRAKGQHP